MPPRFLRSEKQITSFHSKKAQSTTARNCYSSGPSASSTYAAICFVSGTVVLISILRGRAAAATGAVISRTPFTYSAISFSTFTPSGRVRSPLKDAVSDLALEKLGFFHT